MIGIGGGLDAIRSIICGMANDSELAPEIRGTSKDAKACSIRNCGHEGLASSGAEKGQLMVTLEGGRKPYASCKQAKKQILCCCRIRGEACTISLRGIGSFACV